MTNKKGIALSEIVELYEQGLTPVQISEKFGCCCINITRRLKKAGIPFKRDYSKSRRSIDTRVHSLDVHYFDTIDTEEKAYFLGLMFADGSVSKNQFYLKMIDRDIIERFKEALKTTVPIRVIEHKKRTEYNSFILEISSVYLCTVLSKWGCTPNKTRTIRLPKLDESLYVHFIRGFFDGDGHIGLNVKPYHCKFDIVSAALPFLEDIRPIITSHAKTDGGISKEAKYDVYHLRYSGYQVKDILDWLYKDATVYLKRKYFKYQLLSSF